MLKGFVEKLTETRTASVVILLVALAALGAAFAAQFVFGLKPCILCLYARIPYALLIVDMLAALVLLSRYPALGKLFLASSAFLFLIAFGISVFHIGVEHGLWTFGTGCPVESLGEKTEAQALAELLTTPLAPCDKVAWRLLGFSITYWNAALALFMAVYAAFAAFHKKA